MKTKKLALIVVLLASVVLAATETKRHFHIHQTSLSSLEVRCDDATPAAEYHKDTNTVVVTCR